MRLVPYFIIIFISLKLHAQTKTEIERINFFPEADAFMAVNYQYNILKINTPQNTVGTKSVSNYKSLLAISYAHKFSRKMFIGLTGFLEEASENGILYGIPTKRRFSSFGPKEPEFFTIYRLRFQQKNKGLVDLFASFSPKKGTREIGSENADRWNGRYISRVGLSHGMWEEEWEFRSSIEYVYYGEGEEENKFSGGLFVLENYSDFIFNFKAQYRINKWLFAFGSVGVEYHTDQEINEPGGEERVILAGTGSVFQIGIKKPLGEWSSMDLSYVLKRNDYFVKGPANNLEGDLRSETLSLNYVTAF